MDDYLEQRIRVLELEVEELKEQAKPSQVNTWIWAFIPILALLIPVLALVGNIF
ncbi:hypothetical protein SAMN05421663_101142 [Terribacillus halophilus]|uniref:Uncharacterized protein n=1 Tax=Terribacillus halophilus TaxID=361279 RepID=A0A1G6I475_9BACI|nr:hypothetical protein [Terribacillus halophilus]SDC01208.1 hypothetical protein SAMN05421663_101142 [Terribacillus halophilus]